MVRYLVAAVLALSVPCQAATAPPARTMFEEAGQRERAVRTALAEPKASAAVLKRVRHVVTSYESVVRRYPTSGYSDDALWLAAHLSLDAFEKFGDVQDRETAVRLLRWLATEYPTSKLSKQVPRLLAATEAAGKTGRGRGPQAPGTASARAGAAGKTSPPQAPPADSGSRTVPAAPANNAAASVAVSSPAAAVMPKAALTGIRRTALADVVRVTIALNEEVAFHDERIGGPSRIFVDFPATKAAGSLTERTLRFDQDSDVVRHVRIGQQPNDTTRVVLDATGVSSYSVYPLYNPYRLVIDCVRATPASPPQQRLARAGTTSSFAGRSTKPEAPVDAEQPRPAVVHTVPSTSAASTTAAPSSGFARASGAEPVRAARPIAGRGTVQSWAEVMPSTVPGGTAVLEAARTPAVLMSRAVGRTWGTGLPASGPAATAAILEAVLPPPALASRSVGINWSRSMPGIAPGATPAILEATSESSMLASRSVGTAWARSLPRSSPTGTAIIRDARQLPAVPALLTSRMVTTQWARSLPTASPLATSAIADSLTRPAVDAPASVTAPPPAPPPPATSGEATSLGSGFSMARQLGLGVSRIVIDPGHGGHDPGAKGKGGATEAELVLDIALRLERLLGKVPGVEVILTRRTDEFIALPERTAIANREGADLFLSIHANASVNDQARGIETYFLNFANNVNAASVAARENATSGQAMGALPDFVKTIALNNKLDESRDFATIVQQSMIEHLRDGNESVKDLGVKQAPFVVLIGAAMPSVLSEISFLTHEQEAKLLKSPVYRQKIAEALLDAIQQYQGSLKRTETVRSQDGSR